MTSMEKLPYPAIGKPAISFELPDDLFVSDLTRAGTAIVPKGTTVRLVQLKDYGLVVVPHGVVAFQLWRY